MAQQYWLGSLVVQYCLGTFYFCDISGVGRPYLCPASGSAHVRIHLNVYFSGVYTILPGTTKDGQAVLFGKLGKS